MKPVFHRFLMATQTHTHTHRYVHTFKSGLSLQHLLFCTVSFSVFKACLRSKFDLIDLIDFGEKMRQRVKQGRLCDTWKSIPCSRKGTPLNTTELVLSMSNLLVHVPTGLCTGQTGEVRPKLRRLGWTEWTDKFWCPNTSSGPMESPWVRKMKRSLNRAEKITRWYSNENITPHWAQFKNKSYHADIAFGERGKKLNSQEKRQYRQKEGEKQRETNCKSWEKKTV